MGVVNSGNINQPEIIWGKHQPESIGGNPDMSMGIGGNPDMSMGIGGNPDAGYVINTS